MGIVDDKLARLSRIERLHRVRRRLDGDSELELVIAELEAELGETVSQRVAARFLGISHTALRRWVRAGTIPLVENRVGRAEVPVPALIRFKRAAEADAGESDARRRVALPAEAHDLAGQGHDAAATRSLAYHRAVAERLNGEEVSDARYRLSKLRAAGRLDPIYADRWEDVLAGSLAEIRKLLADPSQDAADLRQNSPFAGVLGEPERRAVIGAPAR